MYPIKQSTAITVPFFVHDANGDAVTGLSDGSFTKRISKGSAAWGAMTVTISEMENGWYSIPLSTGHSDTLGLLSVTFTNAGAKQVNLQMRVSVRIPDDLAHPGSAVASVTGAVGSVTGHTNQTGDSFARIGAAGAGLTAINLPNQTMDIVGNITGNLSGSVGSVTGAVGSVTGAVGSVAGNVDGNVTGSVASLVGHTVQTGDSFARIGAAGAGLTDITDRLSNVGPKTGTADSGSATTMVDATLTEGDDYWNGSWIRFTSGVLQDVTRHIDDFDAATDRITFKTLPGVLSVGTETYEIVPAHEISGVVGAVGSLVGHTNQTGDSFARIGAAGAGLTAINLPNQTMDIVGNITGNLSGSVGSVTGAVGSVTGAVGSVTGNVDGNVSGSVASVVGHTVQTGDSFARIGALGAGLTGITGAALSAAGVDAILDEQVGDSTITLRQVGQIVSAILAGKLSGAATSTVTIRNVADDANVIVATVDADGNRTAVTLTVV